MLPAVTNRASISGRSMFPCQWSHAPPAAIAVVSRPYEVIATPLPCIDHQPSIMKLFLVTAGEYLGLITSPHKVTSIHLSRHALFSLRKYFGLYYALTNLYPSRHALIITKHLGYNAPSPSCCPQPPTGHRPQVAAGLLANSYLPSLGRCRTSTRFRSRYVYGHKLSNELLLANTRPRVARPLFWTDDMFLNGHMLSNEMPPGTRPH